MVKYCHNCGNEMKDSEKFCPKCGLRAIEPDPNYIRTDFEGNANSNYHDSRSNNPHSNSSSSFNSNNSSSKTSKSKEKSKSNGSSSLMIIVTTICIILILIVLFYGLFPGLTNSNDNSDNNLIIQNQTSHFTIDIENGTYLSGEGKSKMVDSNYSTLESYENFTISGYEAYEIELDNGSWYIVSLYKVDYNTPSSDWVYNSDVDEDGNAYIFFNSKGEYYGYFINIPSSSDSSTFENLSFLTSIFHYNH